MSIPFVPVVIVKCAVFSLAEDATALDNPSNLFLYNKSSDSILPWHMLNENFRSNLLIVSDSLPYIGNKINCMSGYHSWILKGYGIKTNDKFRFSSMTPIPKDTYKSFKFPRIKTACHSIEEGSWMQFIYFPYGLIGRAPAASLPHWWGFKYLPSIAVLAPGHC